MQVFEHPPSCSVQAVLVLLAFAWEIAPSRSLSSSSLHHSPPHPSWPTCWPPRLCTAGTCSRCSCTFQNRIEKVRIQMFKLILRERKLTSLASDGKTRTKVEVCARRERYLSPWLSWQRPRWNRLSRKTTKMKNQPGYWYFARNWSSHCPSSTKQNMAPCKKQIYCFSFIKPVRIIPELQKHVLRLVWVSHYIVEVTLAVRMTNRIWLFVGSPS